MKKFALFAILLLAVCSPFTAARTLDGLDEKEVPREVRFTLHLQIIDYGIFEGDNVLYRHDQEEIIPVETVGPYWLANKYYLHQFATGLDSLPYLDLGVAVGEAEGIFVSLYTGKSFFSADGSQTFFDQTHSSKYSGTIPEVNDRIPVQQIVEWWITPRYSAVVEWKNMKLVAP